MKKILAILLTTLYLGLFSVQVINFHFCHGKLQSISFSIPNSDNCSDKHACSSSCCADVLLEVEFNNEQVQPRPFISELEIIHLAVNNIAIISEVLSLIPPVANQLFIKYSDSPPKVLLKSYIRFHTLIYYA